MKQNWEVKSFEDCLEKIVYTKKIQRKDFLEFGEFPIISQEQEFINGYWNDSEDLFQVNKPVVIFGDHTQVLKYVEFDFVLGADGVKILQPISNLNPKYFYYFMINVEFKKLGYARHYRLLKEISIPFPQLPEQQRIVAILDEAFAAIATAKENAAKNLQNARELFESYVQNVFANHGDGWGEKKLGEVCLIKPQKSEARKQLGSSDLVSFVPMEDLGIDSKYFVVKQVRPLEDVAGSYTYFAEGDILLAKITPCFENGKLGIARNLRNGVGFGSSEYVVFRATKALHNEFLYYFLSREKFREEGAQRMSGAVGHKRVAKDFIENYPILVPPLSEQRSIVTKLDALSAETKKLGAIYRQKLADLEELKKSVLKKAFEGEL